MNNNINQDNNINKVKDVISDNKKKKKTLSPYVAIILILVALILGVLTGYLVIKNNNKKKSNNRVVITTSTTTKTISILKYANLKFEIIDGYIKDQFQSYPIIKSNNLAYIFEAYSNDINFDTYYSNPSALFSNLGIEVSDVKNETKDGISIIYGTYISITGESNYVFAVNIPSFDKVIFGEVINSNYLEKHEDLDDLFKIIKGVTIDDSIKNDDSITMDNIKINHVDFKFN